MELNQGQYWYTRNIPVLANTGMFQYVGPEVSIHHLYVLRGRICYIL